MKSWYIGKMTYKKTTLIIVDARQVTRQVWNEQLEKVLLYICVDVLNKHKSFILFSPCAYY